MLGLNRQEDFFAKLEQLGRRPAGNQLAVFPSDQILDEIPKEDPAAYLNGPAVAIHLRSRPAEHRVNGANR